MTMIVPEVDYGPLASLIGNWAGDSGMDVSPEPDGEDHSPYYETMMFEACGDVDNAETQELIVLRYHLVVARKKNDKVFHNESGYLTWCQESGDIVQSFVIPRGVGVVAGGKAEQNSQGVVIEVSASLDDDDYGIVQGPFMRDNASTQSFTRRIEVSGNELSYKQTTVVDIYGRVFDHTDENTLTKQ